MHFWTLSYRFGVHHAIATAQHACNSNQAPRWSARGRWIWLFSSIQCRRPSSRRPVSGEERTFRVSVAFPEKRNTSFSILVFLGSSISSFCGSQAFGGNSEFLDIYQPRPLRCCGSPAAGVVGALEMWRCLASDCWQRRWFCPACKKCRRWAWNQIGFAFFHIGGWSQHEVEGDPLIWLSSDVVKLLVCFTSERSSAKPSM